MPTRAARRAQPSTEMLVRTNANVKAAGAYLRDSLHKFRPQRLFTHRSRPRCSCAPRVARRAMAGASPTVTAHDCRWLNFRPLAPGATGSPLESTSPVSPTTERRSRSAADGPVGKSDRGRLGVGRSASQTAVVRQLAVRASIRGDLACRVSTTEALPSHWRQKNAHQPSAAGRRQSPGSRPSGCRVALRENSNLPAICGHHGRRFHRVPRVADVAPPWGAFLRWKVASGATAPSETQGKHR
jgi:hypothetical protein